MANQGINYGYRNFANIRSGLVDMARQYYPDIFNDFNDASVGMMLLELNAAVGDMLSFNTDRMFQETQIDYAQEKKSVLSMARTFGLKIPGKRPSVTIEDFSVIIPALGDTFDISYCPLILAGSQVSGAGKVFENLYDIDFSNPFNIGGIPNRLIIPNFNSNGTLINYTITKREIVTNGFSRIFKKVINNTDVRPFLEIVLPEDNVLSVDSIITIQGTNFNSVPTSSQFTNQSLKFYEVDALAENKVFVEDFNRITDNAGVKPGKWITIDKKFITEYTDLGFFKIIFGAGSKDTSSLCDFDSNTPLVNQIGDFINNYSLGQTPTANTTMFIKYRVGGGADTNLGPNIIRNVGILNFSINGNDQRINNSVKNSLTVNNAFPALGGRNTPSVDEIRYMTKYNFASQNRAVTIKDYQAMIQKMPGQFGSPFRMGIMEEQNKIIIYTIGLDENNKLSNNSTSALRENIATYLSNYRMINDYVKVSNGKVINLSFEIDLYVDKKQPQAQIISEVINSVKTYMDVNKYDMGDNIYLSPLIETINNVGGVLNVIDIRLYNKVGEGRYSLNEISQPYLVVDTKQIDIITDYTLFGEPNSMFEIKFPTKDIMVRVR